MNNKMITPVMDPNIRQMKDKEISVSPDGKRSDDESGKDFLVSRKWLEVAAIICFLMAACQAVIAVSPGLAAYFDAPPDLLENRFLLFATGGGATLILVVFGLYAQSGAGKIRRLPLLRIILILISSLFMLRGLFIVLTVMKFLNIIEGRILIRELISHLVFFAAGFAYTGGTILNWREMGRKNEQ
jgi:hypothetical protein